MVTLCVQFYYAYQLYYSSVIYSSCFWNKVSLCSPGWPEV